MSRKTKIKLYSIYKSYKATQLYAIQNSNEWEK